MPIASAAALALRNLRSGQRAAREALIRSVNTLRNAGVTDMRPDQAVTGNSWSQHTQKVLLAAMVGCHLMKESQLLYDIWRSDLRYPKIDRVTHFKLASSLAGMHPKMCHQATRDFCIHFSDRFQTRHSTGDGHRR